MIYFIHGQDTYRSKMKLNELIEKYQKGFEFQKIDGEKIKLDEFINKINSISLLSPKRLIIIENLSLNSNQKEITDFLKDRINHPVPINRDTPPSKGWDNSDDILIFYEQKINKVTSLYKFLTSPKEGEKNIFEFENLKPNEIKTWVQNFVKQKNGTIDRVALEGLLMGNNNLWLLVGEIEKLLAYNKNITLENVQELTSANFDDNIFNLADAFGRGDKTTALDLINKQLETGVAPIYLLSMIIRQFRILILIKEALQKNFNATQIAREISQHPFVVQKSIPQAQKYSFDDLKKVYNNLLELDLKLKSSKLSPESLFAKLVFDN